MEKNKGNPNIIYNSTPINALQIVGHNVAIKRFLDFVMPINATVVQAVPNTTSTIPIGLKAFAITQPNINPGANPASINASNTSTSEKRSCIAPKLRGAIASVVTAYAAAIIPVKAIALVVIFS